MGSGPVKRRNVWALPLLELPFWGTGLEQRYLEGSPCATWNSLVSSNKAGIQWKLISGGVWEKAVMHPGLQQSNQERRLYYDSPFAAAFLCSACSPHPLRRPAFSTWLPGHLHFVKSFHGASALQLRLSLRRGLPAPLRYFARARGSMVLTALGAPPLGAMLVVGAEGGSSCQKEMGGASSEWPCDLPSHEDC